MLLVKILEGLTLIGFDIMICDPKTCDGSPEVTRELGERVQEAILDNLPNGTENDVSHTQKGDVHDTQHSHDRVVN